MLFGQAADSLFTSGWRSNVRYRMRERGVRTVAADRAASDRRNGDALERIGDARQSICVCGSSKKQLGFDRHLERERRRRWRSTDGDDHR